MKSNDVVTILHKGGGLQHGRREFVELSLVSLSPLPLSLSLIYIHTHSLSLSLSSHLNALGELKVETVTSLCICIYCSPRAFAFSYGSLPTRRKTSACVWRRARDAKCRIPNAIDNSAIDRRDEERSPPPFLLCLRVSFCFFFHFTFFFALPAAK